MKRKGFSIPELLVTVAILSVLSGTVFFLSYKVSNQNLAFEDDLDRAQIRLAVSLYRELTMADPSDIEDLFKAGILVGDGKAASGQKWNISGQDIIQE